MKWLSRGGLIAEANNGENQGAHSNNKLPALHRARSSDRVIPSPSQTVSSKGRQDSTAIVRISPVKRAGLARLSVVAQAQQSCYFRCRQRPSKVGTTLRE